VVLRFNKVLNKKAETIIPGSVEPFSIIISNLQIGFALSFDLVIFLQIGFV